MAAGVQLSHRGTGKGPSLLCVLGVREPIQVHPPLLGPNWPECHVSMPSPITSKEMGPPWLAEMPGAGAGIPWTLSHPEEGATGPHWGSVRKGWEGWVLGRQDLSPGGDLEARVWSAQNMWHSSWVVVLLPRYWASDALWKHCWLATIFGRLWCHFQISSIFCLYDFCHFICFTGTPVARRVLLKQNPFPTDTHMSHQISVLLLVRKIKAPSKKCTCRLRICS